MKFTLFSAFLFSIGWMRVVVTGDGPSGTCCLKVTNTRIQVENIVKYEMQKKTTICPVRAVRFHTKTGKAICSDPDSDWAQKAMKIVNGRTTTKPTMCYTSTTNTIPTVSTTNRTPRTQTETSTSTTAPPTVTRIETSRPETEITKKPTNQPTSVSKENLESSFSTATTCGLGGPTSPPAETRRETPGTGTDKHLGTTGTTLTTTTTPKKTKLSKLIIRKRGKSKNSLRKKQMRIHLKNKPEKN